MARLFFSLSVFSLFFMGTVSCNTTGTSSVKTDAVEKVDSCLSNTAHTYNVFVPSHNGTTPILPLLIAIDSHGDGRFAVSHFKEAAEKYKVIVVASNLIKNNFAGYIRALDELVSDVKNKYPVNTNLYVAGFSGGARMALGYASEHPVAGVIACGALAQPDQLKAIKSPVFAIVGMDDFNFVEAAQFVIQPETAPQNLLTEITNASHAWPSGETLAKAVGYFQISNKETCSSFDSKTLIKEYINTQQQKTDSLEYAGNLLSALLLARNMAHSGTIDKSGWFKSESEKLSSKNECLQQQNALTESIRFEMKVRDAYYKSLMQKDTLWWKNEIEVLNTHIGSETDLNTQMAYRRIKGFLGIVCYSLSNRLASAKQTEMLEHIVSIYRMVEPENADMYYFSAILAHLKGNDAEAKNKLSKAKQLGSQENINF